MFLSETFITILIFGCLHEYEGKVLYHISYRYYIHILACANASQHRYEYMYYPLL